MSYARHPLARRAALGDVPSGMSQEEWQQKMLATSQDQYAYIQDAIRKDHEQKWVAIAVTAAIPVFGSIWKVILGRRRRSRMSL